MSTLKSTVRALGPTLFLGVAAGMQLLAASYYLYHTFQLQLLIICATITTGIYLLNRIVDTEDRYNNYSRWYFFNGGRGERKNYWLFITAVLLIAPVIYLCIVKMTGTALVLTLFVFVGVFYSIKILPYLKAQKKLAWVSLKDIPIAKNVVVCVMWSSGGFAVANTVFGIKPFNLDTLYIIATLFICSMINTITCDVRDVDGDRILKKPTLPFLIGVQKTFNFLLWSSIAMVLISAVGWNLGVLPTNLVLLAVGSIVWTFRWALPHYSKNRQINSNTQELMLDSYIIIVPLGLFLVSL